MNAVKLTDKPFLDDSYDRFIRQPPSYPAGPADYIALGARMSTDRIKVLAQVLRSELRPILMEKGFSFEAVNRTFRRLVAPVTQIINFQVGMRSMEGQFTVNLGVYHPHYRADAYFAPSTDRPHEYDCVVRQRLSLLRETALMKLMKPIVKNKNSVLGEWLISPSDKWWPFSANEGAVSGEVALARELLLEQGLAWLDRNSDVALLAAEFAKLKPPPAGAQLGAQADGPAA